MRQNLKEHPSLEVETTSWSTLFSRPANHVTFVTDPTSSTLTLHIQSGGEHPEHDLIKTADSIVYNTTISNDYNIGDLANITINELIDKHLDQTSSAPRQLVVGTFPVPNITSSDPFLSVKNSSAVYCLNHKIPSVYAYLSAINIVGVTICTLGILAVLAILYMYIDTMKHIMKHAPPLAKTHSAFILSVYPVVATATYCAIVVPRAHLLAEAVTQGMFMAALYQLFCLFVAYAGGEAELIKRVKPDSFVLKVPPCCCWPCCCLPAQPVNKTNMKKLRLLVLQLPVVQGLVYMVLLVMWAEEESLYQVNYVYMQPAIVFSILVGIWGVIVTMTSLDGLLKQHNIRGKFFVLQLVLVLGKVQGLLARFAVWRDWVPCKIPITPTVYANLIYNSFMLCEMIVLMYAARKLYKLPVTDCANPKTRNNEGIPCTHETFDEQNNNRVRY